ncbi:YidB family protein [Methylorubrum populi]
MSDGYPSMTALLGLLALTGYQNRDKLAEMFAGASQSAPAPTGAAPGSQGGLGGAFGGGLGGLLGGLLGNQRGAGGPGGFLNSGLGEMLERHQASHGSVAQSWVNHGPNQEVAPHHLEQAIGSDVLAAMTQRTGLFRDELLSRLSKSLPNAVDQYTPEGRYPA